MENGALLAYMSFGPVIRVLACDVGNPGTSPSLGTPLVRVLTRATGCSRWGVSQIHLLKNVQWCRDLNQVLLCPNSMLQPLGCRVILMLAPWANDY